jgi:ubiquinone/menaquinone biosynthesis C-methylase UbiE
VADRARSISFDRIAEAYDATRGGVERGHEYSRVINPLFSTHGRTLEVGVGTGIIALPLRESGRDIVGIDLSLPMALRARDRLGARVVVGDALRLPVCDDSVDDAYSVWVLHLVADVRGALAEVARVLRPGGRYVAVTSLTHRPTDDVGALTWDMQTTLRPTQDDPLRVVALAAEVGLHLVETTQLRSTFEAGSPRDQVAAIEQRIFSATWDVPDDVWQRVVVPTLESIRALPDQDRTRPREHVNDVLVLEKA